MVLKRILFVFSVLILLMAALPAFAVNWGEVRIVDRNLNVRKGRSVKTDHVRTLSAGTRVRVDFIKDGWAAVFELEEPVRDEKHAIGYSNVKYLVKPASSATRSAATEGTSQSSTNTPEGTGDTPAASGAGEVVVDIQEAPPVEAPPAGLPVKINSDRMTYDENKRIVSFVGNVVAVHEGLTLTADKVSAFFVGGEKRFQVNGIDRIIATGNVHAVKETTTGDCGKLTYYVEKRLLVMEQDPVLKEGPNSITGDVIRFYVRENRSEVVGGKGKRVEAEFFTPKGIGSE